MNTPAPIQQQPTSAWAMYRSIVGIGAFCALLIVTVFKTTEARIKDNQRRFLEAAISEVLPVADATVAVTLNEDGRLQQTAEAMTLPVFLAYDEASALVGAVLTAQGMSYQDNIRVLYSYSFELEAIVGFKVLDSKETPGLGDKVEKEPHFIANFEALDTRLSADGDALANPIVTVKEGEKTEQWQIDGITGATITSVAIGDLLNESANRWIPIIERDAQSISPAFSMDQEPEAE
jgi:electron transport complex protein RnfG